MAIISGRTPFGVVLIACRRQRRCWTGSTTVKCSTRNAQWTRAGDTHISKQKHPEKERERQRKRVSGQRERQEIIIITQMISGRGKQKTVRTRERARQGGHDSLRIFSSMKTINSLRSTVNHARSERAYTHTHTQSHLPALIRNSVGKRVINATACARLNRLRHSCTCVCVRLKRTQKERGTHNRMKNKERKSGRWKQELCDTKAIVRFGQQIVVTQILCARREAKCAKAATEAEAKAKATTEAPSAAAATRHTLQNADNARKMHAKRGKQIQKRKRHK